MAFAQYEYAPSDAHPFGQPHPDAPEQIKDYAQLIGTCDCKSISRNPDNTWADSVDMSWTFKYIMNGNGVQDMTLKSDGTHSGSIRQFNVDSSSWYVYYYTSRAVTESLNVWKGNKNKDGDIVLYRDHTAPNGMEGFYRLTFYDISDKGFNWIGEWVDTTETVSFPTWKIFCKRE